MGESNMDADRFIFSAESISRLRKRKDIDSNESD